MSDSWIKNLSNVEKYAKLFLRHKTGVFKSRYKYFSRNELKTIRLEKCRFSFLGYKIRTLCSRESFTAVSYTFDELEPSTCIRKIFNAAGDLYSGKNLNFIVSNTFNVGRLFEKNITKCLRKELIFQKCEF